MYMTKSSLWEWLDIYPRHIELVTIMYYNYSVSPEHQNMCDAYFNSLIFNAVLLVYNYDNSEITD